MAKKILKLDLDDIFKMISEKYNVEKEKVKIVKKINPFGLDMFECFEIILEEN